MVSQPLRPAPDARVVAWIDAQALETLFLSAITVAELRAAFEEAVDDYLETCARIGKAPQQPASGKMMLRVAPEVHSAALMAAQAAGVSLNQWAARVLGEAARA